MGDFLHSRRKVRIEGTAASCWRQGATKDYGVDNTLFYQLPFESLDGLLCIRSLETRFDNILELPWVNLEQGDTDNEET